MNIKNPKVDFYFDEVGKWQEEINQLRTMAAAKQSKPLELRVEKNIPQILKGKGLNE